MTTPLAIEIAANDIDALKEARGWIAVFATPEGKLDPAGRRVNRLMRGAIQRLVESDAWEKVKEGEGVRLAWPSGLEADGVIVLKLARRATVEMSRKAGAEIAKAKAASAVTICASSARRPTDLLLGLILRAYEFTAHKTKEVPEHRPARIMVSKPEELEAELPAILAVAEGVLFTRDLTNAPANILTTTDFADRLAAMADLGLDIEVLEEDQLAELGMRTLLAVGEGSESPSKVVVMQWKGGDDAPPLALVGKGVVFDTGGISMKPAAGMEDMTMDMGGAGVVAGVMRALALRKAPANVVGLIGLVENMPDGRAQRPGDVVTSMKGDTIEVINTDAEGRLVLADVLWYAQERFQPAGMIDLATLTGAIIIGLGHENAGVFSNSDALCGALLKAAGAEGEGAWRMPMGSAYDAMLDSRVADMKNVGNRAAGSITAAQFLQRFVKEGTPWCHIDIAGVASVKEGTALAPKGATGWGVMTLDRLVRDHFEGN